MNFWAEAKRLSYVTDDAGFPQLAASLGIKVPADTTRERFRDLYRNEICNDDGWPREFPVLPDGRIEEGLEVRSLSGAIRGRTTGNRRKCTATSTNCPGWFIEVIWQTGQRMWPCSEGWHYDAGTRTISVIGGGEISARFVSPKPLGTNPAPKNEWPSTKELSTMRGWRISS